MSLHEVWAPATSWFSVQAPHPSQPSWGTELGVPIPSRPTPSPQPRCPRTPYPSAERGEQAGEEERGAHGGAGLSPAAGPELK